MKAIELRSIGGPEALTLTDRELPPPGPGEVRLRHTAIGLNFIDTYYRTGLYTTSLPTVLGLEAAGVVEQVGDGVRNLVKGDRVAYGRGPLGAYAEARNIKAVECIKLPEGVSDELAAAAMVKGLTAWYLLHQTFPVNKGDTVLIHAAAGGVGLLLTQWAKKIGARIIGTVGSERKAQMAKQSGCDEIIFYRSENIAQRVAQITQGQGVEVVYDAVGASTFTASLDSLKPLGMMVSYGQASGPIPPFSLTELAKRGSLFVTRPSLMDYVRDNAAYHKASGALLKMLAAGELNVSIGQRYPLSFVGEAHKALEARDTVGASILIP